MTSGTLTVGTDKPGYPPYIIDDKPTNGKGFESAVSYAIAKQLGFAPSEVKWIVVPVQLVVRAGAQEVRLRHQPDLDHAEARRRRSTSPSPYYTAPQAVLALKGSPVASATSLADLKDAKIGVQVGTTSLTPVQDVDQARRSSRRCSTTPTTPSAR